MSKLSITQYVEVLEKLIPEIEGDMNLFSYDISALRAASAALREQAEREKGCVWCQSHPHLFNKIYELNAVLPVVCPWCGRRLEGPYDKR